MARKTTQTKDGQTVIVVKEGGHGCLISAVLGIFAWPLLIVYWLGRMLKAIVTLPAKLFRRD